MIIKQEKLYLKNHVTMRPRHFTFKTKIFIINHIERKKFATRNLKKSQIHNLFCCANNRIKI